MINRKYLKYNIVIKYILLFQILFSYNYYLTEKISKKIKK